jgi:hypothetical protein
MGDLKPVLIISLLILGMSVLTEIHMGKQIEYEFRNKDSRINKFRDKYCP